MRHAGGDQSTLAGLAHMTSRQSGIDAVRKDECCLIFMTARRQSRVLLPGAKGGRDLKRRAIAINASTRRFGIIFSLDLVPFGTISSKPRYQ